VLFRRSHQFLSIICNCVCLKLTAEWRNTTDDATYNDIVRKIIPKAGWCRRRKHGIRSNFRAARLVHSSSCQHCVPHSTVCLLLLLRAETLLQKKRWNFAIQWENQVITNCCQTFLIRHRFVKVKTLILSLF